MLACARSQGRGVDLTLQRDGRGADVVRAVQSKLDDASLFDGPSTSSERQPEKPSVLWVSTEHLLASFVQHKPETARHCH